MVDPQQFVPLLDALVHDADGVHDVVAVAGNGAVLATSSNVDPMAAERFAAVSSGLIKLGFEGAGRYGGGGVVQIMVEMEHAFLFINGVNPAVLLAVVAETTADLGTVGFHIAAVTDQLRATVAAPATVPSGGWTT